MENYPNRKLTEQKSIRPQNNIEIQKTEETEFKTNKQDNNPHKINQRKKKKKNEKNLNDQKHSNTRRRTSSQTVWNIWKLITKNHRNNSQDNMHQTPTKQHSQKNPLNKRS